MLPSFYLLVSGRFYQILKLNLFMPIIFIHLLLLLTLCTIEEIYKETLLLASTMYFPMNESKFPAQIRK